MRTHSVIAFFFGVLGLGAFSTWLMTPDPRASYAHCEGVTICAPRANWKERTRLQIVQLFPQNEYERSQNEAHLAAQAALNGEHHRAAELYLTAALRSERFYFLEPGFRSAVAAQDLDLMIRISETELRLGDQALSMPRTQLRLIDLYLRVNDPDNAERALDLLDIPAASANNVATIATYRSLIAMRRGEFELAHELVDEALSIRSDLIAQAPGSADEFDEVRRQYNLLLEDIFAKGAIFANEGRRAELEALLESALPTAFTALTQPGISQPRVLADRTVSYQRLGVNYDLAFNTATGAEFTSRILDAPCDFIVPGRDLMICLLQEAVVGTGEETH